MSKTTIAIVTATMGDCDALERCIASIDSQTQQPAEHIVVDGSRDNRVAELLERHRRSDVRRLHLVAPPHGVWDALNRGVAAAGADVVGLLHDNDYLASSDVLERVAETFDSDSELGFVYGDVAFADGSGREVRRYSSCKFSPARLAGGYAPPHPSLYLRRELAEQVGPYKTDYITASDFDYWVRLFATQAPYRYLPIRMVTMSTGGLSGKWYNRLVTNFKEKIRALDENGYPHRPAKLLLRYFHLFDKYGHDK